MDSFSPSESQYDQTGDGTQSITPTNIINSLMVQKALNGWDLDKFVQPTEEIFNANHPTIKEDIIRMIVQYLSDEGYVVSRTTLVDEMNIKRFEREERQTEIKRMRRAILDGDWAEVDKLCIRPLIRNNKSFLYAAYKQQYLEYIEHHEIQKAFTHLNKRIKPLEQLQMTPSEFKDLCYLLTAKSVQDVASFRNWEGIPPAREKLAELFQSMVECDEADRDESKFVPPNRLLSMLRQAIAYQVESSRYQRTVAPKIHTLLHDYTPTVVPNASKSVFTGHKGNVKCVEFVGDDGRFIVSGSSDNSCRLWHTETGKSLGTLEGHTSRVWDVSSSSDGQFVASASGDSTLKIWSTRDQTCVSTLAGGSGDMYTVKYHPLNNFLAGAGYDKIVRLYDIHRGTVAKTFSGHQLSVSKVIFSPLGNLIISGSKDNSIKFWDIVSGLCIKTISSHLGEVTSVEVNSDGTLLLSSSKDNSNRLWDMRMLRPIRKFKGHQNTSKNFIRSSFAGDALIVGGSEDGNVYIWDREKGDILQRLRRHHGAVYGVAFNNRQCLYASCSEDKTIRTWWFQQNDNEHSR